MDPRLELIYADGAVWAKERVAEGMTGTFDVILIDSTDFGPAVPLFSNEFFADCKELLKPGGAIVSNVDSPSWSLQSVGNLILFLFWFGFFGFFGFFFCFFFPGR